MAIQLNDRDHLIFNLINEYEVLLEKHISWFIAEDNKPVLIRDRLRKLFYLDYLLCHRHGTKLPWWTTPTKPLVYLLSDQAKTATGIDHDEVDRFDAEWQRHHLEVANLRMLYLISQKNGKITEFQWKTASREEKDQFAIDARVSFVANGIAYDIGIVNNPSLSDAEIEKLEASLTGAGIEMILMVARDDEIQSELQKRLQEKSESVLSKSCFFSTHQKLYKKGMVSAKWQNFEARDLTLFPKPGDSQKDEASSTWTGGSGMSQVQPISA